MAIFSWQYKLVQSCSSLRAGDGMQCPVQDTDDPYATPDGRLIFAVSRAPVDGAPFLVSGERASIYSSVVSDTSDIFMEYWAGRC